MLRGGENMMGQIYIMVEISGAEEGLGNVGKDVYNFSSILVLLGLQ